MRGGTVPPVVGELVLAFLDAHLGALHHGDHDVGVCPAQLPLLPDQSRDVVTNHARADQRKRLNRKLTEVPGTRKSGRLNEKRKEWGYLLWNSVGTRIIGELID